MPNRQGVPEVEITDQVLAELGLRCERARRPAALFVKGPLSLGWIRQANTGRHTLAAALAIKLVADLTGKELVRVPAVVWQALGLADRMVRRRALHTLEDIGFAQIERLPGRGVRIRLIDKPGKPEKRAAREIGW
jgi:hypothetical protein